MTPEQERILILAQARIRLQSQEQPPEPQSGGFMSGLKNVAGGIGEPIAHMATGMVAKPLSDIAGLAATGYEAATGGQNPQGPEQFKQYVQQGLTYQPRTAGGQAVTASPYNPINLLSKGIEAISPNPAEEPSTPSGMGQNALREAIPQVLAVGGVKGPGFVQRGVGELATGGVPAITQGTDALVKAINTHFTPGGANRAALRIAAKIPEEQTPSIVAALRKAEPGETATQAAAPAGSAEFAGLAGIAEKNAPSVFGKKVGTIPVAQEAALQGKWKALNDATRGLREDQINIANKSGGVETAPILADIQKMIDEPGAPTLARKSLSSVVEDITTNSKNGFIDANEIYRVRKELGNTIQKFSNETANWDKNVTAGIQSGVQKSIDTGMEMAGATGWKNYLQEFSAGASKIGAAQERATLSKALERAGTPKARAEYYPRAQIPNPLMRPIMIINALLREAHGYGKQKITDALSRLMKPENVQELAQGMEQAYAKQKRGSLINALTKRYGQAVAAGLPAQATNSGQQ